jgi:hypothetical protein
MIESPQHNDEPSLTNEDVIALLEGIICAEYAGQYPDSPKHIQATQKLQAIALSRGLKLPESE